MKNIWLIIIALSVVSTAEPINKDYINVLGRGEIYTYPDWAIVEIGAISRNSNLDTALKEVKIKVDSVMSIAKRIGIVSTNIETINFKIDRIYTINKGNERDTSFGFEVVHQYKIKVIVDSINTLLSSCYILGSNIVENVTFAAENDDSLHMQATSLALKNAKQQALLLAQESKRKLGKLIAASHELPDRSTFSPKFYMENRYISSPEYLRGGSLMEKNFWPAIIPNKLRTEATVYVIYKLK